jgi:hypothetical protein
MAGYSLEFFSKRIPRGLPRGMRANQDKTSSLGIGDSPELAPVSLQFRRLFKLSRTDAFFHIIKELRPAMRLEGRRQLYRIMLIALWALQVFWGFVSFQKCLEDVVTFRTFKIKQRHNSLRLSIKLSGFLVQLVTEGGLSGQSPT